MASKRKFTVPTDAEEAAINAGIKADKNTVEWTARDFEEAAAAKRKRGRPAGSVAEVRKKPVTIRLDPDLLDAMRATGDGWQTRANDALRRAYFPARAAKGRSKST